MSARHRLAVEQRDQSADVPIEVPHPRDCEHDPTPADPDRDAADRYPEQAVPERTDHPAMMAVEEPAVAVHPDVVEDGADDARESADRSEQMQRIGDYRDRALVLGACLLVTHLTMSP